MKIKSPTIKLCIPVNDRVFKRLWSKKADDIIKKYELDIDFIQERPASVDGWRDFINDAEAIVSSWGSPQLNAEILTDNAKLRIVAHAAGSVADIVSPELFSRNIKVSSANDIMAQEVADWSLMMALFGIRRMLNYANIGAHNNMRWESRDTSRSIRNSTIGIWGMGSISRYFIQYIKPLNPKKIMVCSEHSTTHDLSRMGVEKTSLEQVFSKSDVIVVLAGMTVKNKDRIDESLLSLVKDGATLLNCGRAGLIQHEALLNELNKNRFTAILDVFHKEPLPDDSPLQKMPNVVLTPHNGASSSYDQYLPAMLEEIHRFFNKEDLRYEVSCNRACAMTSHKQAF